ncbi:glycosyltransferase family 9 protein [Flavobacterium daemonense]|uniref:glycosyltransferase family 9 protein n=1 Tax=Flavobacterium daemonense TaxID=1393049 RepID=UPI001184B3BA|nr:glycosyltransferase family 9 protein [Flavobacterium daemonense]KAF2329421.1 glycosyltransferase family 9 protein [Flavobacterium daemonense]
MSNLKKVNGFRRNIMRSLTKNIGRSDMQKSGQIDKNEIKKVLISRPNKRLGNLLLISPLIQEVTETFPNCKIDLFVKGGLAPIVFENYKSIDKIISLPKKPFNELIKYLKVWTLIKKQNYDVVINVDQNSSSGRLAVKFSSAKFKIFGDLPENVKVPDDYDHIAKYPVYNFRYALSQFGVEDKKEPVALIDLKLSADEIAKGKTILNGIVDENKKSIAIFTFATGEKCYQVEWWEAFYAALKKEYEPEYNVFEILPVENVSQINFQAPSFYSKDVREIGSVMANSAVFIGADSGIMHLASASKVPTVGLFSGANMKKYEPYGNNSIGVDTNTNGIPDYIQIINSILKK